MVIKSYYSLEERASVHMCVHATISLGANTQQSAPVTVHTQLIDVGDHELLKN